MSQVEDCVNIINQSAKNFKPQVGLILGSGLGQFCDNIETQASIDFDQLPGFPIAGVGGHAGRLLFGQVGKTNIVVMQGRAHYYEQGKADGVGDIAKKSKNINMNVRTTPQKIGDTGFKARAISENNGKGLRIRSSKNKQ